MIVLVCRHVDISKLGEKQDLRGSNFAELVIIYLYIYILCNNTPICSKMNVNLLLYEVDS